MKIPEAISLEKEGVYCVKCFSTSVKPIKESGLTHYKCRVCGQISQRRLIIDAAIEWWIDAERNYWHEGVGIFLSNSQGKLLFFERTIFPFAYTIPAGHLDKGETPDEAVKRELLEETRLTIDAIDLICEEDLVGDECSRGSDAHRWHLYKGKSNNLSAIVGNSNEGKTPIWLTLQEALQKNLTFPSRYFIEKYGEKLIS